MGRHGTPESRAKYHNIIGNWEAPGRRPEDRDEGRRVAVGGVSVRSVREYIQSLVRASHGVAIARALQLTIDQYGDTSAARFWSIHLAGIKQLPVWP